MSTDAATATVPATATVLATSTVPATSPVPATAPVPATVPPVSYISCSTNIGEYGLFKCGADRSINDIGYRTTYGSSNCGTYQVCGEIRRRKVAYGRCQCFKVGGSHRVTVSTGTLCCWKRSRAILKLINGTRKRDLSRSQLGTRRAKIPRL